MSNRDLFQRPFGAAEEWLRQDRARRRMIDDAMGSARFMKDATDLTRSLALARELQGSGTLAEIHKTMKQNAELARSLNGLVTPSWALTIRDTSLAIANQQNEIARNFKMMSAALDNGIVSAAKALQEQNGVIAAALASAQWRDQMRTLSEQIAPALDTFRMAAEHMALVGRTLEAAGDESAAEFYRAKSAQARKVESLVGAIGDAETPEESGRLFALVLSTVAVMVSGFVKNSQKRLSKLDIFDLMTVAGLLLAIFPPDPSPTQPAESHHAYSDMVDRVMTLSKAINDALEESNRLDEAYVADLPYAELTRRAIFRTAPSRDAPIVWKAPADTRLALKETRGRWRLVVFRDPLTDSLSQGWVYGDAVNIPG